ncbi:uncharacterized protein [Dysidea avara]|uniref:uncharacterized protein isoform X1 n=1 Tax=Dysidea avara TaxID=196820 RepID=UPI0033333A42
MVYHSRCGALPQHAAIPVNSDHLVLLYGISLSKQVIQEFNMSMSKYAEELENIDFTNPEDIFDFSARPSSEEQDDCYITHYSTPLDYSKLPRKLIAEPSVKLSDLQSMAKYSYNNYTEVDHQQIKIQCTNCGSGFICPNQHAGEQLYYCPNCQVSFSQQKGPTPADHMPCHQTDKMHCCICGQVYQDLARFIYHCQSHDESEYHKVCTKKPVASQPHTAEGPPAPLAIPRNDIIESSNNGDDAVNDEANILIVNNPIYFPSSTFPLANYRTVSPLSLHSSSYYLPSRNNQVVYYNHMCHHNQMALRQHYLNMQLHQSINR